ncbi:MAG: CCA tRNA nucleotidyltransferase [Nanohaloarchaea archaeon]|nr:CCA tRNA nucleotidyltransferase [Candidatus Nanohaloarchaea archaeon]
MEVTKAIFDHALKKIRPDTDEVVSNQIMFDDIRKFIKEKFKIEARLMGSVAKNTFIAGDKDLDIFIFFPPTTKKEVLETKGLLIGKSVFKKFGGNYQVSYAEHPYTKGKIGIFDVEIVPAYKITSTKKLMSAVDRTPFHTKYVLDNLKNPDEVRLLKKFMKAIGVYGSDLKTNGFSGYLCELLILRCKTFNNLLKHAQKWNYQEIMDLENGYKKSEYKAARTKFNDQPLIFIDPTDKNRNVAAVLSIDRLARFIYFAGKFIDSPSIDYFFRIEQPKDKRQILRSAKERGTFHIAITFKRPDLIEDILYPQLRRFRRRISDSLEHDGFVMMSSWEFGNDECGIAFELLNQTVPRFRTMTGPRIFDPKKNRDNFEDKYEDIWFEGDRMVAEVRRKHFDIMSMLGSFFDEDAKALADKGVPKNLAQEIAKNYSLVEGKDILKIKSEEFWNGLSKRM